MKNKNGTKTTQNLFENQTVDLQKNFAPPPAFESSSRSDLPVQPAKNRGWSEISLAWCSDKAELGKRLFEYLHYRRTHKVDPPKLISERDRTSGSVETFLEGKRRLYDGGSKWIITFGEEENR